MMARLPLANMDDLRRAVNRRLEPELDACRLLVESRKTQALSVSLNSLTKCG